MPLPMLLLALFTAIKDSRTSCATKIGRVFVARGASLCVYFVCVLGASVKDTLIERLQLPAENNTKLAGGATGSSKAGAQRCAKHIIVVAVVGVVAVVVGVVVTIINVVFIVVVVNADIELASVCGYSTIT